MRSYRFLAAAFGVALSVSAIAAPFFQGWGKSSIAVTTTTGETTGFSVGELSVYNTGTSTVYVLVNCTTSQFNTAMASTSAVPVLADTVFTFDTKAKFSIDKVCYGTLSGVSTIHLGGF